MTVGYCPEGLSTCNLFWISHGSRADPVMSFSNKLATACGTAMEFPEGKDSCVAHSASAGGILVIEDFAASI